MKYILCNDNVCEGDLIGDHLEILLSAAKETIKQSKAQGWDDNLLRVAIEKIEGTYIEQPIATPEE